MDIWGWSKTVYREAPFQHTTQGRQTSHWPKVVSYLLETSSWSWKGWGYKLTSLPFFLSIARALMDGWKRAVMLCSGSLENFCSKRVWLSSWSSFSQECVKELMRCYTWELIPGQDLTYKTLPVSRPKNDIQAVFTRLTGTTWQSPFSKANFFTVSDFVLHGVSPKLYNTVSP